MNPQLISIISTLINLGLGISKLIFGFLIGSIALIADGVHSGIDVFSSFVTFLGFRVSKKPVDEKHPYGHQKAESLAGFLVVVLLVISGVWILYETGKRFFGEEIAKPSVGAVIVIGVSILLTEILARLKFHYGKKYRSLSLVADAEHSRADVLSSIGVLVGLGLIKYFSLADVVIALGIGGYILFRAFWIGKEITDSLLDVANKDVEERIKKICRAHNIEVSDLKSRKIGAVNFAEVKIKLPPKLKVEDVQKITEALEERFLKNIPELKQIVISVEAYQVARSVILTKFGEKIGELEGFERIGPKKLGERLIIPLQQEREEISPRFGEVRYLVIDKKAGKIFLKKIIKNPYFKKDTPHGARFAKAVRADKVLVYQIGPNAKQTLENFDIKIKIIPFGKNINTLLEEIKKEDDKKD